MSLSVSAMRASSWSSLAMIADREFVATDQRAGAGNAFQQVIALPHCCRCCGQAVGGDRPVEVSE